MENAITYIIMAGLLAWSGYNWRKILDITRRKNSSTMWPLAIGKVTKKDVSVSYGSRGGRTYTPKVSYAFSVLGNEITRTVSLGNRLWEKDAKRALEAVGETIKARYNPQDPRQHIAEIEKVQFSDYLGALLPLLFFVGLLVMLLFGKENPGVINH